MTGSKRSSGTQTVKRQTLFYGLSAVSATSKRAKERFPSSIWHPNRIRNWTQMHGDRKRDQAILAVLIGCALRRSQLALLTVADLQQGDGRSVFIDIAGM